MSALVSVIITCFNLERYVGEAIRSALDQQLDRPFEVIVVDDCSTDRSPEIIRSTSGVRYVRTARNSGVMLAMLEGIAAASGELLFFLDGDDVWERGKLAACVPSFDTSSSCVVVTHDLTFVDKQGKQLVRRSREVLQEMPPKQRGPAVIDAILRHLDFVWLGSAFGVRRSLGKLDEFDTWARSLADPANTYQDWPLAFWVASLPGVTAGYVPECLLRYRLHQANYSGDASSAPRAARNFMRARNTLEAMATLSVQRDLPGEVRANLQERARAYSYLTSLYRGHRLDALRALPSVLRHFAKREELTKELVRLAAVLLVGPDRFARRASRHH